MQSFQSIAKDYKAIFLDSYGVVKNYNGLIPGIDKTIAWIRDSGKILRILTNDASRSQEQQVQKFAKQGIKGIKPDEVITSGMMAKMFLEQKG